MCKFESSQKDESRVSRLIPRKPTENLELSIAGIHLFHFADLLAVSRSKKLKIRIESGKEGWNLAPVKHLSFSIISSAQQVNSFDVLSAVNTNVPRDSPSSFLAFFLKQHGKNQQKGKVYQTCYVAQVIPHLAT